MTKPTHCPNDGNILEARPEGVLHCPICLYNISPNRKVLNELYAWFSVDPEGREGFMAAMVQPGLMMALLHSEYAKVMQLEDLARGAISEFPGYRARLIRFRDRETIMDKNGGH